MCGLAGIVAPPDGDLGRLSAAAKRMASALRHRGPDGAGTWSASNCNVVLSHVRLSIIDLSEAGNQPMRSGCGRFVVAFNGEIYNFGEIRAEIEAENKGVNWRGHSDTEVLVEAVATWGVIRATQKLLGMFAFAVFDQQDRTMHLVRDRFGEKPLYYGWVQGNFVFASELKALRYCPGWARRNSKEAVASYFRFGFVPAPLSVQESIYKLLPGTVLSLSYSHLISHVGEHDSGSIGGIAPVPYWSMEELLQKSIESPWKGSIADAEAELDWLLQDAVKRQMVADVELGALLSGGIDSTSVVASMRAASSAKVSTFSIGFSEEEYDEARYAKAIANHFGTTHTELYVQSSDAVSLIPQLTTIYDEPFSDFSQIPTYLVAKLARQSVSVALSGDGGDEIFGGYNRHFSIDKIHSVVNRVPRWIRSTGARALLKSGWPKSILALEIFSGPLRKLGTAARIGNHTHKLARALIAEDLYEMYLAMVSHWESPTSVVPGAGEPLLSHASRFRNASSMKASDAMMFLDSICYLPDNILVKLDRAAMAVGLETRAPFLDHRVAEFAWRLPPQCRFGSGQGKVILRNVLKKHVPPALTNRPKSGFSVPIGKWLRGPLRDWAETLLSEDSLHAQEFLSPNAVRTRWTEHLSGANNWESQLWDVLTFQAWSKQQSTIDSESIPATEN